MNKPDIHIDLNDPYIRSYVERCRHCDPTVITDDDRKADHDARRREKNREESRLSRWRKRHGK